MNKIKLLLPFIAAIILGVLTLKYELYLLFLICVVAYDIYLTIRFVLRVIRYRANPSDDPKSRITSDAIDLAISLLLTIIYINILLTMNIIP